MESWVTGPPTYVMLNVKFVVLPGRTPVGATHAVPPGVKVEVAVTDEVAVVVAVKVAVFVPVTVPVAVRVAVAVAQAVLVPLAVPVAVRVGVPVAVRVAVADPKGVEVGRQPDPANATPNGFVPTGTVTTMALVVVLITHRLEVV